METLFGPEQQRTLVEWYLINLKFFFFGLQNVFQYRRNKYNSVIIDDPALKYIVLEWGVIYI